MIGTWVGVYSYDRKWMHEGEIPFQMVIEFDNGSEFSGTVQDDPAFGGDPVVGKITGRILGDLKIEFAKEMPRQRIHYPGPGQVIEGGKPYQIQYLGALDSTGQFSGTWKIKGGFVRVDRKLVLTMSTSGRWSMVKTL